MATRARAQRRAAVRQPRSARSRRRSGRGARGSSALFVGALVFLFPFYYMIVGSLQKRAGHRRSPARSRTGEPDAAQLRRDQRRDRPRRSRCSTPASSPAACCSARWSSACSPATPWRGCISAAAARCSRDAAGAVVPFQLLIIPLYVLIVRNYGLADTYLGMILPFAINSTAVFIFRQFFLQLPEELFEAARIDGASELRILLVGRAAAGAAGAAHRRAADLHRSVERVPLAVPGHQGADHAAARGVAGQLHQQRRGAARQPVRRDPGRRVVLAAPAVAAVHRRSSGTSSRPNRLGGQGLMTMSVPCRRRRGSGVVMSPDPDDPYEAEGVLNPASGRTPDGRLLPAPAARGRRATSPGSGSPRWCSRTACRWGSSGAASCSSRTRGWERGASHAGVEDPRVTWVPALGLHLMTYVAYGPLGPRPALAVLDGPARPGAGSGPVHFALPAGARHGPQPVPEQGRGVLPGAGHRPRTAAVATRCCTGRCGTSAGSSPGEGDAPAGRRRRRPARHLDLATSRWPRSRPTSRNLVRLRDHRLVALSRVRVRGAEDRRRAAADPRRRGLAADPSRRDRGRSSRGFDQQQSVRLRGRRDDPGRRRPVPGAGPHRRAAARAGDRRGARRHRAERGLPDGDRGDRRRSCSSSTGWRTPGSAWRASTARNTLAGRANGGRARSAGKGRAHLHRLSLFADAIEPRPGSADRGRFVRWSRWSGSTSSRRASAPRSWCGRGARQARRAGLADAQREIARGLGFAGWPALVHHAEAAAVERAQRRETFVDWATNGRRDRAQALLDVDPSLLGA